VSKGKRKPHCLRPRMDIRIVERDGYTHRDTVSVTYINYTDHPVIVRDMVGFAHQIDPDNRLFESDKSKSRAVSGKMALRNELHPRAGEFQIARRYSLSSLSAKEARAFATNLVEGEALDVSLRHLVKHHFGDLISGNFDVVIYFTVLERDMDNYDRISLADTGLLVSRFRDVTGDYHPHPHSERGLMEYSGDVQSELSGNGVVSKLIYATDSAEPKMVFYRSLGKVYKLIGEVGTGLSNGVHLLIKKGDNNSTDCLGGDSTIDCQFSEDELTMENGFFTTREEATSLAKNPEVAIQDLKQQLKNAQSITTKEAAAASESIKSLKTEHAQALQAEKKRASELAGELNLKERMIEIEKTTNDRLKSDLNSAQNRNDELNSELHKSRAENEKIRIRATEQMEESLRSSRRHEQERRDHQRGFMDSFGGVLKIMAGVLAAVGSVMTIYAGLKAGRSA